MKRTHKGGHSPCHRTESNKNRTQFLGHSLKGNLGGCISRTKFSGHSYIGQAGEDTAHVVDKKL